MITLRIEEILKERGITKTQFAEMMGVAKQNVNLLLNTNNTQKMEKIAEVLGVKFTDLFVADDQPCSFNATMAGLPGCIPGVRNTRSAESSSR